MNTIDNIQWVVKEVNLMKNQLSERIFLYYAKKLVDFNCPFVGKIIGAETAI